MLNKNLKTVTLFAYAIILFSCTKEPLNNLTQEESRIYVTNADTTINFGTFKSYSISDSVAVLENGKVNKDLQPSDQAYIDAVNKYMQQRGYEKVPKENSPDIGIDVNRIYNTSTGYFSYDDYWNYYGSYWDPYYWGYDGYGYSVPTFYGIYQITEGAMSIDMLDLKNASEKNNIEVVWNGLVRGEGIFNSTSAEPAVKALFDQSTYLQTN